jgi:hypothetical protein
MPARQVAAVHPFRVMLLTPGRPKVAAKDLSLSVGRRRREEQAPSQMSG